MVASLTGLDHVVIGVRDLDPAQARFERLGFTATPPGRHVGWGTANRAIMLEGGYLELLTVVDPAAPTNGLDRFLERREGVASLALGTSGAAVTYAAWAEAGLDPEEPRELGRRLLLEQGEEELRFANVVIPPARTGGIGLFACEHRTRDRLRRPEWLRHGNGARLLKGCVIVADDAEPVVRALGRLVGSGSVTRTDAVAAAHVGGSVLLVAPPEDADLMHPGLGLGAGAPEPEVRLVILGVRDLGATARFFAERGLRHVRNPAGEIGVPATEAHGVALEFTA